MRACRDRYGATCTACYWWIGRPCTRVSKRSATPLVAHVCVCFDFVFHCLFVVVCEHAQDAAPVWYASVPLSLGTHSARVLPLSLLLLASTPMHRTLCPVHAASVSFASVPLSLARHTLGHRTLYCVHAAPVWSAHTVQALLGWRAPTRTSASILLHALS